MVGEEGGEIEGGGKAESVRVLVISSFRKNEREVGGRRTLICRDWG